MKATRYLWPSYIISIRYIILLASTCHTVAPGVYIANVANNPKGQINLNQAKEKALFYCVLQVARLCSIAASEKVLQWRRIGPSGDRLTFHCDKN